MVPHFKKLIAGILIVALVLNLFLFGSGRVSGTLFWILIGATFLVSYFCYRKTD